MIIGIDEVGRGCIAGDLVVCAFAVKPSVTSEELHVLRDIAMDSKAFSSRKRRSEAAAVVKQFGSFAITRCDPGQIDKMNIRGATLDAMARAAQEVEARCSGDVRLLFDGRDIPAAYAGKGEAVIKGDASILEISCASIIAKVLRDEEMDFAAEKYPGYGFERHAGYGTKQHVAAIKELGLCPIHRSWARKFAQ
jgi:ribonuclease HII